MITTIIINMLILAAALFFLVRYITICEAAQAAFLSRVLLASSAVGLLGGLVLTAVCLANSGEAALLLKIDAASVAFCLIILLLSYAVSRGERSALLRLATAPLWSMLTVLGGYAVCSLSDDALLPVFMLASICAALLLLVPAALDFRRLGSLIEKDDSIADRRRAATSARALRRLQKKNAAEKRKKLRKSGKGSGR